MKLFLRKLKTASTFSLQEWKVIIVAYYLFLKVRFLLLFLPAQIVEKALFPAPKDAPKHSVFSFSKQRILSLFRIAWRYQLNRPKCLQTSLAQRTFLAHFGFASQLFIGVKKEHGRLRAHAWCKDAGSTSDLSVNFETVKPLSTPSIQVKR